MFAKQVDQHAGNELDATGADETLEELHETGLPLELGPQPEEGELYEAGLPLEDDHETGLSLELGDHEETELHEPLWLGYAAGPLDEGHPLEDTGLSSELGHADGTEVAAAGAEEYAAGSEEYPAGAAEEYPAGAAEEYPAGAAEEYAGGALPAKAGAAMAATNATLLNMLIIGGFEIVKSS